MVSRKFVCYGKQKATADSSLTTPKLHPKEQRPLFGDPGKLNYVWGPVLSE
jgi:hypothetical protein